MKRKIFKLLAFYSFSNIFCVLGLSSEFINDSKISEFFKSRRSEQVFVDNGPVEKQIINDILDDAMSSPSSFNFQNWRFLVLESAEAKEKLSKMSGGQTKIKQAATVVVMLGDTKVISTYQPSLRPEIGPWTGYLDPLEIAQLEYGNNKQLQRDEAIRSASIAGMNLIMSAHLRGLATAPVSGFDESSFSNVFGIEEQGLVPAVAICIGHGHKIYTKKQSRKLSDVTLYR